MALRRNVLLWIGCLSAACGCGQRQVDPVVAERAEVAFQRLGGVIVRDNDAPGRPVVRVDLGRTVNRRCGAVTDADLRYLDGLESLEALGLAGTRVTDAGLAHLHGLTRLRWLDLDDTIVTDAGLGQLYNLAQLEAVYLQGTAVTEAGVAALRRARPAARVEH